MPKAKKEKPDQPADDMATDEQLDKREIALRQKVTEQLIATTGHPAAFDHLTVSFIRPHLRQCRANFVCRRPVQGTLITGFSLHIAHSFYLTLTPFGEILESNPPLKNLAG